MRQLAAMLGLASLAGDVPAIDLPQPAWNRAERRRTAAMRRKTWSPKQFPPESKPFEHGWLPKGWTRRQIEQCKPEEMEGLLTLRRAMRTAEKDETYVAALPRRKARIASMQKRLAEQRRERAA